jgi:methionine-rich copper-binding protein CopC
VSRKLFFGLFAAAVLSTQSAVGHAKLQTSSPPDHAQLAAAPSSLTLTFSENAQLAMLELKTVSKNIPLPLDRGAKPATTIKVGLPVLGPGTYEVKWTALAADDGHITKGSFSFTVLDAKSP